MNIRHAFMTKMFRRIHFRKVVYSDTRDGVTALVLACNCNNGELVTCLKDAAGYFVYESKGIAHDRQFARRSIRSNLNKYLSTKLTTGKTSPHQTSV